MLRILPQRATRALERGSVARPLSGPQIFQIIACVPRAPPNAANHLRNPYLLGDMRAVWFGGFKMKRENKKT
jgi:hypothetical protein